MLYIGGFELPDKNAAAQRVIGVAKSIRDLGYDVVFLNSLKVSDNSECIKKEYFGFETYEYKRESQKDYLITGANCLKMIGQIKPSAVIAYNYPGFALERIRKYCKSEGIKCIADATEWYRVESGNPLYRIIKTADTSYRMKTVQPRLDGIIAISDFLYDYYKDKVDTVKIPPTVDIGDEKWKENTDPDSNHIVFTYAGSPSLQKERLDLVVSAIEEMECSKEILLNIVGITEQQFRIIYGYNSKLSDRVRFLGRVDHKKAIDVVKSSDWSVIIRDNNFVVNAGFPTKLVESISCGVPVIINRFSNIDEYIDDTNGILVNDISEIKNAFQNAVTKSSDVRNDLFDYRNFMEQIKHIL